MGRAVVPVLAGVVVIGAFFGLLWLIAVVATNHANETNRRARTDVFEVGRVDRLADSVARNGPMLFPNLVGPAGERPVGLTHDGPSDFEGWRVFSLRPRGDASGCLVHIDRATKALVDCQGRVVAPDDLAEADRVEVVIADDGTLSLDLQPGT